MEQEFKKVNNDGSAIKISDCSFSKNVEAVQVKLESSTSTARVMNIAVKMLALNWTDRTIDDVEKMVDERLVELTTGKYYHVTKKNSNGYIVNVGVTAGSHERAEFLATKSSSETIISTVETE